MISLVQHNSVVGDTLPYMAPNTCGNLGLVNVALKSGALPTNVTDDNGNSYGLATSIATNIGDFAFYLCLALVAGSPTNNVHVNGAGTTPRVIIAEFTPPVGIQTFNGPFNINANFVSMSSYLNESGSFQHVFIMGIYNDQGDLTWSISSGASIIDQTHVASSDTSALGFISSSVPLNTITFSGSPAPAGAFILGLTLNG